MKKILSVLLVLCMMFAVVACNNTPETTPESTPEETPAETPENNDVKVMTYAEYDAAAMDAEVVIEAYVQATQSWWADKIVVYLQDKDGGYLAYNMACSEADAAKLTKGTKIRVSGFKGQYEGEIEIVDGSFEFIDGADTWVAEAMDATALLGTDDLIKHQNKFVSFKGLTIDKITYKNDGGDDIYVDVKKDDKVYSFCVERYLTDPETDVYKAFADLKAGDIVDIEGFLYWYQGVNTHITAVTKAQ